MELTDSIKQYLEQTRVALRGSVRRRFMARTVRLLGHHGQRLAERELGWNRGTVRKGMRELDSAIPCLDAFSARGRLRSEERLPQLLEDIRSIVDAQSQTDPSFRSLRLYTRLTAAEVRRQLILQKGYPEQELPCSETIRLKMRGLGYSLRKVAKCRPQKKSLKPRRSSPN